MAPSVLITGTSKGGIGDHLAQEFHGRGFKVVATARDLRKVEHLQHLGITTIELDVTSLTSIESAVREAEVVLGHHLDVLVNNSGAVHSMPVLDTNVDTARNMFEVNFFGVLRVTQAFSPMVIAARGQIINISSIVGLFPNSMTSVYNASKAALNSLSDSMRIELAPFGVQVVTVIAGTVATNLVQNQASSKLPAGSRYLPVQSKVEHIMSGNELVAGAMDPKQFARRVVDNTVKGTPNARLWYGTSSSLIWFITTFFKHTFLDSKLSKDSGLTDLRKVSPKIKQ